MPPKPNFVVLIGFMGAGKTSVGRALAESLGWEFVDLDERIVACEGRSIAEIFRSGGEALFRKLESEVLEQMLQETPQPGRVLALGGGAFAESTNRERLRRASLPVVYLESPLEELRRRCAQPGAERPLASDANQFRQLYERRIPAYMEAAVRIQTDGKTVAQVAAEVAARLGWDVK